MSAGNVISVTVHERPFSKQTLYMRVFLKRSFPRFTEHKLQTEFLRTTASDSQSIITEISYTARYQVLTSSDFLRPLLAP
jgi:hypothetical protein